MTAVGAGDWLPPSLEQVRRGWEPMCLRMRLTSLAAAAQARAAVPVEFEGTTLTVSVASAGLRTLLEKNIGVVEKALTDRYGGSWTVRVRLADR